MARSADPLRRADITQQAQGVNATITAPSGNSALQLAAALQDISPEARRTMQGIAERGQADAKAQAKSDALVAAGAKLGDAVRAGTIEPTSNPWYVQAYSRESAAVRGQSALSELQVASATWAEKNDPEAFASKWREEVGLIARGFGSKDEVAGFAPVESQFTQQALQSNVSQNVTRITTERDQNASALLASDLHRFTSASGGTITADQAGELFANSRTAYLAVGGTQESWNQMAVKAVTTAAYSGSNAGLLDLLKAPELVHGPSGLGAGAAYGDGAHEESPALPITAITPVAAAEVVPGKRWSSAQLKDVIPFGGQFTSGVRTAKHNKEVGGVPNSQHVAGTAIDVVFPKGTTIAAVRAHYAAQGASVQVIDEGDHFHIQGARNPVAVPASAAPAIPAAVQAQDTPALLAPPEVAAPQAPARGPSLYDIAGVADQVESDRFRIQQAQENAQQSRLRALTLEHKVQGTNAYNQLYEAHGTSLLTGQIPHTQLVQEMEKAGYKPQAIAEALRQVRSDLQDNAGVATARMQLNQLDPGVAKRVMDLQVEATRGGLTDGLEERVGSLVLQGVISGDDGARIISSGINRSRNLIEENRADTNYAQSQQDRVEKAQAKASGYKVLKQTTTNVVGLVTTRLTAAGLPVSPKARASIQRQVADAAGAWMAANPGDFIGAERAARATAANLVQQLAASVKPAKPAPSNTSANSRRK